MIFNCLKTDVETTFGTSYISDTSVTVENVQCNYSAMNKPLCKHFTESLHYIPLAT
jgi:hypothetical protein